MSRILILKTGETAPEVSQRHGDFDRWFIDAIRCAQAPDFPVGFDVCDVTREPIPATDRHCGVIVTGSPKAVYNREPWMETLEEFLKGHDGRHPPVLCVCFSMQMLAHARGGRVVRNPKGWEIGGAEIRLTPAGLADPLFAGLPERFGALATHEDHVEELPKGCVLLAGNEASPVQAFRAGDSTWGVQFHPEASVPILERLIHLRAGLLERDAALRGADASGHVPRLIDTLASPKVAESRRILTNFLAICRGDGTATSGR